MPVTAAIVVPHPPLILPEIGKGEQQKIQRTIDAYGEATRFLAESKPSAVVLLSPHSTSYADYFHISPGACAKGDFARFQAPFVRVNVSYDEKLAQAMIRAAQKHGIPAGTQGERDAALDHATMIPLWFLQAYMPDVPIVRIGLSGLPALMHYRLGQIIAEAAGDLPVAIIASGDLSHRLTEDGPYGFRPEGRILDQSITEALAAGDFLALLRIPAKLREHGAECGLGAIQILAGTLDGHAVDAKLLSYEGPFGVGYAVATLRPKEEDTARHFGEQLEQQEKLEIEHRRSEEDAYVRWARDCVENYVMKHSKLSMPEGLLKELLERRAGVFVSLHQHGQLRGCIGTILPTTGSIAEEILQNAISASSADPRFDPVQPEELSSLTISVDVLGEPEDIASMQQLDPARYGVIVSSGMRRGLLLPDLEGVDTIEEQVDIACKKAGIHNRAGIRLQRFEVVRHT